MLFNDGMMMCVMYMNIYYLIYCFLTFGIT